MLEKRGGKSDKFEEDLKLIHQPPLYIIKQISTPPTLFVYPFLPQYLSNLQIVKQALQNTMVLD
jgi:hypothetical protein